MFCEKHTEAGGPRRQRRNTATIRGPSTTPPDILDRALDLLFFASGVLVATGAGMGVDSGHPDFRGTVASGEPTRRWRQWGSTARIATPRTLRDRRDLEAARLGRWRQDVERLVILDLGADTTVTTVRSLGDRATVPLVPVNPRDFLVRHQGSVGGPATASEFLRAIKARYST